MDVLRGIKKLTGILLFLSFISFALSPITSLLGIEQQPPVANTTELLRYIMISGFIMIVFAVTAVFVLGYVVLTGWRGHRQIPKVIRLLLAFILGALVFSLSGPLSMVIPIPLVSVILTTLLLWAVLRTISNLLQHNEQESIGIDEAILSARDFIKQVEPSANIKVLESRTNGNNWKITLCTDSPSFKKYNVNIDTKTGGIVEWKST